MATITPKAGSIEPRVLFFAVSLALASCGGKEPHPSNVASGREPGNSSTANQLKDDDASTTATGAFTTRSTTTGVQPFNGMLVVTQDITFTATGDVSGTAPAQDTVILNPSTGTGFFFGSGMLTGTVLGKSGSIRFDFSGSFTGYPALPRLQGSIVFLEGTGTGPLSGLSGEGTLQGILDVGGTYSIEVRFGTRK